MERNDIPGIFRLVKFLMVVLTVVITGVTIFVLKTVFSSADEGRNTVYVVDSRNTLKLALAENVSVNRIAEAEASVKRLHELLFILSPDADYIRESVESAEYFADNSVKSYCNSQKESGFYNSLVANGVSTEFICDSVLIDVDPSYEYRARLFGKTSQVFSDKIIFKNLVTECFLQSCERNEMDPQGFYVVDWKVVRHDEIGVAERKPFTPELKSEETDSVSINE